MSEQTAHANETLVRQIVRSISNNDFRALIDALDEDVVWISNSPPSHFRFGGTHLGRGGVQEYIAKMSSEYSYLRYEIEKISVVDDQVWASCDIEALHLASGRSVRFRAVLHLVCGDSKVMRYEGFFDTASVLQQTGTLPSTG